MQLATIAYRVVRKCSVVTTVTAHTFGSAADIAFMPAHDRPSIHWDKSLEMRSVNNPRGPLNLHRLVTPRQHPCRELDRDEDDINDDNG